jgi:predicted metalloprotease with PDZ domain
MPIAPIRYRVAMPQPQSHEFHITMEIPALPVQDDGIGHLSRNAPPSRDALLPPRVQAKKVAGWVGRSRGSAPAARTYIDVIFPAWAPGSYLVRDFSRHIYDLEIRDRAGKAVEHERLDKQCWRVHANGGPVTIRYRVFAFEVSVRTSFLDNSHAFLSGTSLFFFVEGELARPCVLAIEPPAGWHISTALPALRGQRNTFSARDYDELVDSPVEVGTHQVLAFRVDGTRFEVALHGHTNADLSRIMADLRAIVRTTGTFFGGFPFARYLFIIHAQSTRGGLEHANSCTLDIVGLSFEDEKGYQSFDELAAHEFFHAWNVKRIHDRVLGPFDYTKENYTRLLWFHEGFTEHMQAIILLRAGLLSVERYLKDLAEDWTRYAARPGRNVTPLSELSYEAWIKQYKPADNHTNRMVSYYDKGRWAGLALDLILRSGSAGRRGLPDLFRRLWSRHAARGHAIDAAILRTEAEAIAGRSLAGYFHRFIDGTVELPVPELLRGAGVKVRAASPSEHEQSDKIKARRLLGWSGLVFANNGERESAVVKNVIPESPAWRAGLSFGDDVVAVAGARVSGTTVGKRLADGTVGQEIAIAFFRRDRLHRVKMRLVRNPERKWTFTTDEEASPRTRKLRARWLGNVK